MCEEKGWMVDLKEEMGVAVEAHEWATAGYGMGMGVTPAKVKGEMGKRNVGAASPTKRRAMASPSKVPTLPTSSPSASTPAPAPAPNNPIVNPKPASITSLLTSSTTSTTTPATIKRAFGRVLSSGAGHNVGPSPSVHKPFKAPRKVAKVNPETTPAGAVLRRSRVVGDIVRDVWGDGAEE